MNIIQIVFFTAIILAGMSFTYFQCRRYIVKKYDDLLMPGTRIIRNEKIVNNYKAFDEGCLIKFADRRHSAWYVNLHHDDIFVVTKVIPPICEVNKDVICYSDKHKLYHYLVNDPHKGFQYEVSLYNQGKLIKINGVLDDYRFRKLNQKELNELFKYDGEFK